MAYRIMTMEWNSGSRWTAVECLDFVSGMVLESFAYSQKTGRSKEITLQLSVFALYLERK